MNNTQPITVVLSSQMELAALLFSGVVLLLAIAVLWFTQFTLRNIVALTKQSAEGGPREWTAILVASTVALFGILISGIFLFMTLQINTSAERAAAVAAVRTAESEMRNLEPRIISTAQQTAQDTVKDQFSSFAQSLERGQEIDIPEIEPDSEIVVDIQLDSIERRRLNVQDREPYIISARGLTQSFDTELFLYEVQSIGDETVLVLLDHNDDYLDTLDSRIEITLDPGNYLIDVREWSGSEGRAELSVIRAP